jgi:hypothetical protein
MLDRKSELSDQIRRSGNGHMQNSRRAWSAVIVNGGAEIVDHISFCTGFVRNSSTVDFSLCLRDAMLIMAQKRRGEDS